MTLRINPKPKWKEIRCPMPYCRAYAWGDTRVMVGQEPEIGWHLSISTPYRNPTWEEIREARYAFIPDDVTVAMYLPPRSEYVNVHEFCFHLHEVHDPRAILNVGVVKAADTSLEQTAADCSLPQSPSPGTKKIPAPAL